MFLQVLGCGIVVRCHAAQPVRHALAVAFGGMRIPAAPPRTDLEFAVDQTGTDIRLTTDSGFCRAADLGDLLYELDKGITLALQRLRRDLCFIHGGALVAADGRVIVLTAASGGGKSTLTWALLHHGFRYLSDELAPVEPGTLGVHGYPHALCLKRPPPDPYRLPAETLITSRTLHVPVAAATLPGPLAAVLFVDHRHAGDHPVVSRISPARAAIRLYANTLNPLAHPNAGLDIIAGIVERVPAYAIGSGNLAAACDAIRALLDTGRNEN